MSAKLKVPVDSYIFSCFFIENSFAQLHISCVLSIQNHDFAIVPAGAIIK
jgi:hypothetical protein